MRKMLRVTSLIVAIPSAEAMMFVVAMVLLETSDMEFKNGSPLRLPAGSTEEQVLDAGIEAIRQKVEKDAAKGRTWSGAVTIRVDEVDRPFIVKNFADGYVLYRAAAIRVQKVEVKTTIGKTKKL